MKLGNALMVAGFLSFVVGTCALDSSGIYGDIAFWMTAVGLGVAWLGDYIVALARRNEMRKAKKKEIAPSDSLARTGAIH